MPDSAPIEGEAERGQSEVVRELIRDTIASMNGATIPMDRWEEAYAQRVYDAIKEHWLLVSRDPSDPQRERMVESWLTHKWAFAKATCVCGYKSADLRDDVKHRLSAALSPEEETE